MLNQFPSFFADANSNYNAAEFVIFGIPYDKTSTFRHGAAEAPSEIRKASWNFEPYRFETGVDFREVRVHDFGDLPVKDLSPKDMVKEVEIFVKKIKKDRKFPVAIGGEHSVTLGIVKALGDEDFCVLSLDAHLDYRDEYEGERFNHACVIKRISEEIGIEKIAILGFRSADKEEYRNAINDKLFFKDIFNLNKLGLKNVLKELKKYFGKSKIYLTLDIDVLDPAYAPGTSTPHPFGLTTFQLLEIIDEFSEKLIGFDIVEVCPPYDNGETSLLAAELIRTTITKYYYNVLKIK
ncbi:agmatinase [Euryarchaeota archaeon ex4484_162]|nr:MAG: agmatinase [Euryarchaeota archaeon ex4484_162]RLF62855.1 MAG: agmatinase [Thermoplasmata archaeon]